MLQKISSLLLKMAGWKVTGEFPYHLPKTILIVAPHTSNWDFPLGILVRKTLKHKIKFIGKHTLFKPPIGWLMRWMGGVPIDRTKKSNLVQSIVEEYNKRTEFSIVLAPEGTRKKVKKFKTGFYYIAKEAGIPIIPVKFDYPSKTIDFGKPFFPGDNSENDIKQLEAYFRDARGRHPELGI